MGEKVASLYAEVSAKTEPFEQGLSRSKDGLTKLNGGLNDAVRQVTGFDLATLGAGAALGALAGGLKYSIEQAMEAERVMALTESTITATGGSAGKSAVDIERLASRLSLMTGIEDSVIQSGQNMLLTFKEIKGDTFDRASAAMNDMAVAMNGGSLAGLDLKGTAVQLGKALNDPVAGLSALSRVGVTFTEQQKKAIKEMVALNNVAGAQALILAELESEFGGAAEAAGNTAAGNFAKLKNTVSELAEEIGARLLPVLNDAAMAATLLLQWNERIDAAYAEQITRVTATAASYEEYVDGVLAAAVAAQKFDQSWVDLNRAAIQGGDISKNNAEILGLLTEQLYATRNETSEATRATDRQASAEYSAAQASAANAARYQGLADALGVTTAANYELATAAGSAATTQQANADAAARAAEAQAAAQTALDNRTIGYYNLAAALKDTTAQELAQEQMRGLQTLFENGVLSQEEYKTATENLGLAFGIFTPQSLALSAATDMLVKLYAAGKITADELTTATGNLEQAAADGKVDLDELGITVATNVAPAFGNARDQAEEFEGVVERLNGKSVSVQVNTNYTTSGSSGPPGATAGPPVVGNDNAFAGGADFVVPAGFPNDSFPMRVQSGEHVQVTPAGATDGDSDLAATLRGLPGAIARAVRDGIAASR